MRDMISMWAPDPLKSMELARAGTKWRLLRSHFLQEQGFVRKFAPQKLHHVTNVWNHVTDYEENFQEQFTKESNALYCMKLSM
jgi:hypothetical protein